MKTRSKNRKATSRTVRGARSWRGRDAAPQHRPITTPGITAHSNVPKMKPKEEIV